MVKRKPPITYYTRYGVPVKPTQVIQLSSKEYDTLVDSMDRAGDRLFTARTEYGIVGLFYQTDNGYVQYVAKGD